VLIDSERAGRAILIVRPALVFEVRRVTSEYDAAGRIPVNDDFTPGEHGPRAKLILHRTYIGTQNLDFASFRSITTSG